MKKACVKRRNRRCHFKSFHDLRSWRCRQKQSQKQSESRVGKTKFYTSGEVDVVTEDVVQGILKCRYTQMSERIHLARRKYFSHKDLFAMIAFAAGMD